MGAIQVPFYSKREPTSLISIESCPQVMYSIVFFPRRIWGVHSHGGTRKWCHNNGKSEKHWWFGIWTCSDIIYITDISDTSDKMGDIFGCIRSWAMKRTMGCRHWMYHESHIFGNSSGVYSVTEPFKEKTRWSPRTRMLTRMLMVQVSKHMVMQSPHNTFLQ